jgi:Prolipoprotein diacylglyceryl transferase
LFLWYFAARSLECLSIPRSCEAIGLGLLGWVLLRWRRSGVRDTIVLARYLVGAGALRFAIEFIRVNERVAFGLSVAHLVSLAAVVIGIGMLIVSQPPPSGCQTETLLNTTMLSGHPARLAVRLAAAPQNLAGPDSCHSDG